MIPLDTYNASPTDLHQVCSTKFGKDFSTNPRKAYKLLKYFCQNVFVKTFSQKSEKILHSPKKILNQIFV